MRLRGTALREGIALTFLFLAVAATAPAGALALEPLSGFGSIGEEAGQTHEPGGIAIAADGSVYVADFDNERIDVFGPEGEFRFAFGREVDPGGGGVCTAESGCRAGEASSAPGAMSGPEDVAFDSAGDLLVADVANNRIDVFSPGGSFLYAFAAGINASDGSGVCTAESGCLPLAPGHAAGGLFAPKGLAIDSSDHVYVSDTLNDRVSVFSAAGAFLYAFGPGVNATDGSDVCTEASGCESAVGTAAAGGMATPHGIHVSPVTGNLFVADYDNHRVDVFSPAGAFLYAFGLGVDATGGTDVCDSGTGCQAGVESPEAASLRHPTGLAVDSLGDVYVADLPSNRVSEFTSAGSFVRMFGSGVLDGSEAFQECTGSCHEARAGRVPGATPEPFGVAVDCRGAIYVAETEGEAFSRIERFGEPGTPPCPPSPSPEPSPSPSPSPSPQPPPTAPPTAPDNAFTIGRVKGLELGVRVASAGTVRVAAATRGRSKARGTAAALKPSSAGGGPGLLHVRLELTRAAAAALSRSGKLRIQVTVTFTPHGGEADAKTATLALRRGRSRPESRRAHRDAT